MKPLSRQFKQRHGQVMLEYLVVFAVVLGLLIMTSLLYYVFKEQSVRVLNLAASEYP